MERFLQYLFDGLSQGSVYAVLALGLVIIYRGTGHLNFAHGEMALLSTYFMWQVHTWGIPVGFAVVLGVAFGFTLGAFTEVVLIRPVARKSQGAVLVVAIGLLFGLNWLSQAIWGPDALPKSTGGKVVSFPKLFPGGKDDFFTIAGATWRYKFLGVLVVVLLLTALLFALFNFTKLGLAMRAVASNADSAHLVGIKTGRVLMISWGMAVGIGALGGILVAGLNDNVNPTMMFSIFIYAAAAATLGGFDSPGGAVISGLGGVIENMAAGYVTEWVGPEMKQAVALVIILTVLLVRPSGLFGTAKVERV